MDSPAPLPPLVEPGPRLTPEQTTRYARHLLLPHIGEIGQRRLLRSRVAVVGAGGLGSPVLLYLAAAGVGTLGIIDDDVVEATNLQRQVIHSTASLGESKASSAARAITRLNPDVTVVEHAARLDDVTAEDLLASYDLVIDGSDNFPTRYIVNDTCDHLGLPFVWASLLRSRAQVSTFWRRPAGGRPGTDLRDLFPLPPDEASVPSCGDAGVLGALCAQVGGIMAGEAIKLVVGAGRTLLGRVQLIDSLDGAMSELPLRPQPRRPRETRTVATTPRIDLPGLSPAALRERLNSPHPPLVLDVREPGEVSIVAIEGSVQVPLDRVLAGDLPPEVRPDRDVVVHCKSGPRAETAATALAERGFTRLSLLEGGVLAWIAQIDPSLPTY